jgi:alkylhydroperoxidase family enzyme
MANSLAAVPWESCVIEPRRDRALEALARETMGVPNPAISYFASVPWLAHALLEMHPEHGLLMHLDPDISGLVQMVVSQENSCRFCYSAVRAMMWAQGMSQERIERTEEALARGQDMPPRTLAAVAFGRSQSRTGPPAASDACAALRAAGVTEAELKEIAYSVAITDFSNRAHTIPAIPSRPLERMPEQWLMRLIRPLVGRIVRSRTRKGAATPLGQPPEFPYGEIVRLYDGSPIAPRLARTLGAMWASDVLTRRCKLLILAVVARGLSCSGCAAELTPALAAEGLEGAALDRILTHLDGPELDSVERLIVPFARETLWYEPQRVQRHARALRAHLSEQQLLEAIGVAALGNGLCRMGAILRCAA